MYGDSYQSCLVAIVVPDEDSLQKWVANLSDSALEHTEIALLCQSEKLKLDIMTDIKRLSKEHGLNGFETPKAIYLDPEQFAVEKGLVTPTFKLKRPQLRDYFQKQIDKMYAQIPPPLSKL